MKKKKVRTVESLALKKNNQNMALENTKLKKSFQSKKLISTEKENIMLLKGGQIRKEVTTVMLKQMIMEVTIIKAQPKYNQPTSCH